MRAFIEKLKRVRNDKRLQWFWRYAIGAKIHIATYRTTDVVLLRLDLIGDCTMFTSAARAIRELYKNRRMTVICLTISKPIFERLGCFDEIITVDFNPGNIDFKKLEVLISNLRQKQYDLLLQPQISKLPLADILGAAIKCNRRIAIQTKTGNSSARWIRMVNFLYDEFIAAPEGVASEFDYYGAFVRGLGHPEYRTTCPSLPYGEQHFIEGNYYVMYPGGSFRQKFWESERFARLADHIYHKTGLLTVILGGGSEHWKAEEIKVKLHPLTAMSTIDLMGRTSISDVIDIIGNSKFVVSNDTSGVHIACATQTPSVVVVGGWHFERFLPYHIESVKPDDKLPLSAYVEMPCYHCDWNWDTIGQRNTECLNRMKMDKTSECIDKITYEQMWELVNRVIKDEHLC